ncbi:hypothetical protein [Marinobacterium stanieri]|uniref:hypothetical protein n=1 Tax=Marinobacterium stanieri TaxID=49186 RepID=UPI0002558BEF|nr:hypothetical protein [Marinobacterium stanieri]
MKDYAKIEEFIANNSADTIRGRYDKETDNIRELMASAIQVHVALGQRSDLSTAFAELTTPVDGFFTSASGIK